MTRNRRSPRSMSSAFGALADGLAPATTLADVQRVWRATVGDAIAAVATPTAERAGVVTVSCTAAVWAQELDLMAPDIIGRLRAALPGRRLERLRCIAV